MANVTSLLHSHVFKNTALILLSLWLLPISTTILFWSYAVRTVKKLSNHDKNTTPSHRRTILVTGVGMTKGLALARLFHKAGHKVIGADFESDLALVPGRVSNSISKFYSLQKPAATSGSGPYVQGLLDIIQREAVEIWVSCSGVASAVEDGEAKEIVENRTNCHAVQFDVATTQTLHEKHTFIRHTEELGLAVPETHTIQSRKTVNEALRNAPAGRQYIMKPIGMDDSARGDMTLLPKLSEKETSSHLDHLRISDKSPWILQQFIKGNEYCTHSLIIRGKVKAFVACPSSELLMYYEALPLEAALSKAMFLFTARYATAAGPGFTGHLSFDFLVEDYMLEEPAKITLYPIECNPRAHTAVALFNDTPDLVDAYLTLLGNDGGAQGEHKEKIVAPNTPDKYYWIGHDLVTLLILPFFDLIANPGSLGSFLGNLWTFLVHLLFWRDGTWTLEDPLPWWWLYHIYWPMRFLACLRKGIKWSRVNVSTLKIFEL